MKVRLTPEAEHDLGAIFARIARDDPPRAASFAGELRIRCLGLGDFPRAFPLVPRYERHGIRRRLYRGYLLFYRIGNDGVEVLRVIHGRRDYEALLFPE